MPLRWSAAALCAALALSAGPSGAAVQPAPELLQGASATATGENGKPARKIVIDFDSTAEVKETDGRKKAATPSGLTDAQKQKIIATVQAQYDAATGAGGVEVVEKNNKNSRRSRGKIRVVVSGGGPPGARTHFGESGRPDGPGIVYVAEIKKRYTEFTEDQIANAISEVLAHEVGHKLGLSHNWDRPATKMSEGSKVTEAQLRDATLEFNRTDSKTLKEGLGVTDRAKKSRQPKRRNRLGAEAGAPQDTRFLAVSIGTILDPPPVAVFAIYLNTAVTYSGGFDARFGFISRSQEFVEVADAGSFRDNPGYFTFLYDGFLDFALRLPATGELVRLGGPAASYSVSTPNPYNPGVFSHAEIGFETSLGPARLSFDILLEEALTAGPEGCLAEPPAVTCSQRTTGGFVVARPVPLPQAGLMLAGGGLLLCCLRRDSLLPETGKGALPPPSA